MKESQYGGGNICIDSTGRYLFSILGTTLNVIDVNTGETVHKLESVRIVKIARNLYL